jgi:hypothetical protein
MISGVPPPALSDLHPAMRLACRAWPLARRHERRAAGSAARGRGLAPHHSAAPAGPGRPAGQRRDHRADRAARHREPWPGVPADPGRAPQARSPGRRIDDPPDPQGTQDSCGTGTAHRCDLAAIRRGQAAAMLAAGVFHADCAETLRRLYWLFVLEAGSGYVHIPRGGRAPGWAAGRPADPQSSDGPRSFGPRTSGSWSATAPGSSPNPPARSSRARASRP